LTQPASCRIVRGLTSERTDGHGKSLQAGGRDRRCEPGPRGLWCVGWRVRSRRCRRRRRRGSGSGEGSGGGKDRYLIGVSEPVGGQPWRELALATLQNLANQPEYEDRVTIKIVRTQNNDPAAQNAAMRNLISSGIDALIFDPRVANGC
jgi:hypothetical protein